MSAYALSYELLRSDLRRELGMIPPDAKVLTVPEIMDVRRRENPLDETEGNPWRTPYLTSSTEYRGLTPAGNDVVVVHHPQAALGFEYPETVDRAAFWRLLEGEFGEVSVFDAKVARDEDAPLRKIWPMMAARVGGDDLAHAVIKQVERQTGKKDGQHLFWSMLEVGGSSCMSDDRHVRYGGLLADSLNGFGLKGVNLPGILSPKQSPRLQRDLCMLVGYPDMNRTDRYRIAVRHGATSPTAIAPAVTMAVALNDPERKGWREGAVAEGLLRLRVILGKSVTDGEVLKPYAYYSREGWPGHAVTSFEEIGGLIKRASLTSSYEGLQERVPEGANAYLVVANASGIAGVVFGRATVDASARFPTEAEFYDWDTRTEMARLHAEVWWARRTADRESMGGKP